MSNGMANPKIRMGVAVVTVLGFFTTLGFLIFHEIPTQSRDVVSALLGCLVFIMKDVFAWYFKGVDE